MKPQAHILLSLPIAIILYYFFKEYAIIFFLASFLFDVDHYIEYVFHEKDISLINAYKKGVEHVNYARKYNKLLYSDRLQIFHIIEFYLLILILAFYSKIFLFVFIGLIYHQFWDLIEEIKYPVLRKGRAGSLIMWLKRRINK